MNLHILVSIIIPTYNEEKIITKCLNSVLDQSYNYKEIIIINDGSTDNTQSTINRNFPQIKLYSIKHSGPGNARNYGGSVARGEILAFVDADMVLSKNYIENLINPIIKKQADGTYSTAEYILNKNNIWSKCWNINNNLPLNKRISKIEQKQGKVFRAIIKTAFVKLKGFNPNKGYYDDHALSEKGIYPIPVNNAVCYHNNPELLKEVYFSARWIGRSEKYNLTFRNIIRYSIINSLKISITKICQGVPFRFVIFKIIFDLGITTGMFFKSKKTFYAK